MRLGVVLPLLLMCVLLGGVMIFLPLFWFADPRTPGCSPGDRGWDCGWEYSEAESRKSDQNPHLEGGGGAYGGSISFSEFVFPATLLEHVGLLVGPSCFGCNGRSFPHVHPRPNATLPPSNSRVVTRLKCLACWSSATWGRSNRWGCNVLEEECLHVWLAGHRQG